MLCTCFVLFSSSSGDDDGSVGGCCRREPYVGSVQVWGACCALWGVGWLNSVIVRMT